MSKVINLKKRYVEEIVPQLQKKLNIKNVMAVPKITKVTLNVGLGSYIKSQSKDYSNIVENLAKISGQKPVLNKSKKAISNFKSRKGEIIGTSVTIRGNNMYDFVNKLVNIVFPRVRDFRGISPKAFDKNGNYSIGFKEHIVFPEISPDDVVRTHGLQVNITTTANNPQEGLELLKAFGFPIITK